MVVAILSGVGIGLFVDEIGKFLTQNSDYFYPPAAPIIYVFFLIGVLIYLQVKRPSLSSPRSELYFTLEMMGDVLDHDLDKNEQAEINRRLTSVAQQTDQPELASLAEALLEYCVGDDIRLAPVPPERLKALETKFGFVIKVDQGHGSPDRHEASKDPGSGSYDQKQLTCYRSQWASHAA